TNHRNTLEIARVAQYFYAGTDAGIPVLPTRRGRVPPYVIEYVDLEYFVTRIIRHAGKYPHDLIAVVTHNNKSQDAIKEKLEPACRNTRTRFECYRSENKTTVNFDRAGILLLNIQSVKGLEFDCVLIADLHEHYICSNSVAHKMRLYVATSRATDRLFVLYRRTGNCPLLAFLPGKDIVERYTLNDQGTPS
ncbi:MAG: hypothetical protein FJ276_22825, partial [Planctomycetes bacterium]|nr:hypothetical protein [Planctomycetota bacterium]